MAMHYEEQLSNWDSASYTRPALAIRIMDGRHRLVTHILLPAGLTRDRQVAWRQEKREEVFQRFHSLSL